MSFDRNNPPKGLQGKATGELRQILVQGLRKYSLPASWGIIDDKPVQDVRDPNKLFKRIDELCDAFALQVSDVGELFQPLVDEKRVANPTYLIQINEQQRSLLERAAYLATTVANRNNFDAEQQDELDMLYRMFRALPTDPGQPGDIHGFCL